MGTSSFLTELKRRNVIRMAGLYLVGAWLTVQVAGTVLPMFDAPTWLPRSIVIVLAIGFVPALIFSWVFELTPDGIKRDEDVKPEESIAPQTAQRMNRAIIVALAIALAYFGFDKFVLTPRREAALVAQATQHGTGESAKPAVIDSRSIAVLPFESLSADKSNAYFVSGMQDMILTSLSKLEGLKVISRTSTEKYASRPENLRQVAAELGVAHILEGSVQRAGDTVLINLQLIDARTDDHLWAESYERQVADVFSVEREVAGAVATALRAKLLPTEIAGIGQAPTANPQALDLYLRGEYESRKFYATTDDADAKAAIAHFEQAVATDPKFALAYAELARARLLLYWNGNDTVPDQALAAAARDAANRAVQLQPDLPESKLATANIEYRLDLDYPGALASFNDVLSRRPQLVNALMGKAQALRRLGRYDEAIATFSSAVALDPRDSAPVTDRGITRFLAGQLDAAEADFRRSLSINPDESNAAAYLGSLLLYRDGNPDVALKVFKGHSLFATAARVQALACARRFDAALSAIDQGERTGFNEQSYAILTAQVLAFMGKPDAARQLLAAKMPAYRKTLAALPVNSGNGQVARFQLALAEAILGNQRQALALADDGLRVLPPEKDLANGSAVPGQAARVYAMLDRTDLLLPMLERIRALNGTDLTTSAAILRLDPVFDKVRNDPGFQAEIARFAEKQAQLARRATP